MSTRISSKTHEMTAKTVHTVYGNKAAGKILVYKKTIQIICFNERLEKLPLNDRAKMDMQYTSKTVSLKI